MMRSRKNSAEAASRTSEESETEHLLAGPAITRVLAGAMLAALAVLLGWANATSAATTALATLAASMQPGTWATLTTSNMSAAFSSSDTGGGAEGNIAVYSDDAVWDPVSRQIFFIGGDHNWNVPATTKFVTYSDSTNSWQKFPTPPWASGVTHGYHHTAVDPLNGIVYHRPYNSAQVRRYNVATRQWDQPPMPAPNAAVNCCDALEYFPELGGLVWVNGNSNVYLYKPSTNQWTTLATNLAVRGTWQTASYNPVHKVMVFYSDGSDAFYKLSSSGTVTRLANPPVNIYDGSGYAGVLTVDPVSGRYLALSATAHQLYSYDVLADTWQAQSSAAKPNMNGYAVVAAPVSTYGVTFFAACSNSNCNAYLYKHSAGGGAPSAPAPAPADTTAPVVSITSPASGTTVSGTITVAGTASDNVGISAAEVKVDAGSFSTAAGTASWSYSLNTTALSNGSHTVSARARDVNGNMSPSPAVTINVNNAAAPSPAPPPPTAPAAAPGNFQTICGGAGVLKCVGFDSNADITGTWGDNSGILPGDATPQIDTEVKASGIGSLKFTIPSHSGANSSGSYFTNFSGDLATQFGANSEFYVQWRQRFSPEFLNTVYSGGGGWKQAILGTGDKPGCSSSSTNSNCYSSCTALETVTQNVNHRGFAQMYNSCTGSTSHGPYEPFQQPVGSSDFKLQNARPAPYCLYSQRGDGYFPPAGNCLGYFPNEWMTFQVHIKTGPRVNDEFTNSYVQLWIAREGQAAQMAFDWGPYNLSAGSAGENQKFGKIWLLPYNTGKNSSASYPVAYTWYDDLVISTQPISMEGLAGGSSSDTPPDTPPTVSMTSPANGAAVSGTISVSATASDNTGVAGVQFKLDGANLGAEDTVAPYSTSWNTATASIGSHTLTAVARDSAGNQKTAAAVTVTVGTVTVSRDTTRPTVSINSPANGALLTGKTTISAAAADNVGVAGVQFKLDGANLGAEDTTAPYSTSWDITPASNGFHTLRAVARDAAGNVTTSAAISVLVANTGLIGHWTFNEGAGVTAADSSGNGNTGTLVNNPAWPADKAGLKFNATDNGNDADDPRVVVGTKFDIPALPFTLAAWINPADFTDWRAIFSKRDSYSASRMRFDVGLSMESGAVYLVTGDDFATFSYTPPKNAWTHIAVVASSADTKLYVNGVLRQTIAAVRLGTGATANTVIGGTGETAGGDNDPFKGLIDEVRVYNRALSGAEVQQLSTNR